MKKYLLPLSFLLMTPGAALAADGENALNGADTAYVAIAALLVLIMTPALGFFLWRPRKKKEYNQYES